MENRFSEEAKELIGQAHHYAMDLGAHQFSTIHILIASMAMEWELNPKELFFKSEEAFHHFYQSQRMGEPKDADPDQMLPLTREAMKAIRLSLKLTRKIKSERVHPIHVMLAACSVSAASFASILQSEENVYDRLYEWLTSKGFLHQELRYASFLHTIRRWFT